MTDSDLAAFVIESYSDISWRSGDLPAMYKFVNRGLVIAIPGTRMEIGDWLRDLDAVPRWTKELGVCHRGFVDGAQELLHAAPLNLSELVGCTLVGHSLGGAIAILIGAFLATKGFPPREIVTFGAPRCGSWKLRRVLRSITMRMYRCGDDPVPLVPWLPGLYVPPRPLIQIGKPALDPIADHHIDSYRRALKKEKMRDWVPNFQPSPTSLWWHIMAITGRQQ